MARGLLAALLVAAAQVAHGGLGFENENQFHGKPFTHSDLTFQLAQELGLSGRPEVGMSVATSKVWSPLSNASMEFVDSATTGLENGAIVRVRLTNTMAPTLSPAELNRQWVGVFGPAGVNVETTTPIKYTLPTVKQSYAATGAVVLEFRLVNMRVPLDIVFFDNCTIPKYYYKDRSISDCRATLRLGPVTFADYDAPLRVAVLRDARPDAVRVAWTTATLQEGSFVSFQAHDRATGAPIGQPRTAPAQQAKAYAASDLCMAPASTYGFFDPGVRHLANLTSLPAGSRIRYSIVDAAGNQTGPFFFNTSARPGPEETASLLVYADLGRGTEDGALTWEDYGRPALNTSRRMLEDLDAGIGGDGIYHVGDISYAVGFLSIWDTYGDMMQPVLSRAAYAIGLGNHESDNPAETTPAGRTVTLYNGTDSGGECGVPSNGWYPMPWASVDAPWYSYDVGPVHVVTMSTEHDFRRGSAQHAWIAADLASVDRNVTPWVLFGGHRPMYIDSTYGVKWASDLVVAALLVEHVEPLLVANAVDVAVWGHNHVVQRLCRLEKGKCTEHSAGAAHRYTKGARGVVHLVIGAAGASFSNNRNHPPLPMTEFVEYDYGHSRMRFEGRDRMTWQWVSNSDGSVIDAMEIVRGPSAPVAPAAPLSPGAIAAIAAGSAVAIGAVAFLAMRRRSHPKDGTGDVEKAALRPGGAVRETASPYQSLEA